MLSNSGSAAGVGVLRFLQTPVVRLTEPHAVPANGGSGFLPPYRNNGPTEPFALASHEVWAGCGLEDIAKSGPSEGFQLDC
jgi:hypothetical protein